VGEVSTALLALGQQVLQQQQGGEQPGVCFAMVPLLIPATMIIALRMTRSIRRLAARTA
jgi:hypothetical protein